MDAITDIITILQQKRENADVVFHQLFSDAKKIAEQLDVELRSPRITNRQIHRANNLPAQSVEEYYRRSIYIPLLDHIINDLQERLSPEVMKLFELNVFLPKSTYDEHDLHVVRKLTKFYNELLDNVNESTVLQEYKLWIAKWQRELNNGTKIPQTIPQIIDVCDSDLYPNVKKFLHILATIPVSGATAERSFSTLRRLKTWLRSTMGEERLTGLALLNIHHQIEVNDEEVIDRFGRKKRKIDFIL